jgi:hypothetical protein
MILALHGVGSPGLPPWMLAALRAFAADTAIGGVICGCGDAAAQALERRRTGEPAVDQARLAAVTTYGAAAVLFYHPWYLTLVRLFPEGGRYVVLKKVCRSAQLITQATRLRTPPSLAQMVLELGFAIPCFEIPGFTCWTGIFGRGQTAQQAVAQCLDDYGSTLRAGWLVWGPASALTFRFVAPQWQLTALYGAGALWTCVISTMCFDPAMALERKLATATDTLPGTASRLRRAPSDRASATHPVVLADGAQRVESGEPRGGGSAA